MSDDLRKQEVLASKDAIRGLAAEMRTQSEMSQRFEVEARMLHDSRMAFYGMADSVQQAILALERTHTGTRDALVEIAQTISGLEGRLTPAMQAADERIA